MAVSYPSRLTTPSRAEVKSSRIVKGSTLLTACNALNHFPGWRRPWHVYSPTIQPEALGADGDLGWPRDMGTRIEFHKFPVQTSPLSRHMEVVALVAAYSDGGTTDPYIRVQLRSADALTVIDEGVTWARTDGTLPGGVEMASYVYNNVTYFRVKPQIIATGGHERDGLASVPGGPPRMLYFGDDAGDALVVDVTAQSCWLISMTLFEYPEATL